MKQGIHPNYGLPHAATIHTRDTKPEIRVEVLRQSAIPSTLASRSWLTPADVLSALSAVTPWQ